MDNKNNEPEYLTLPEAAVFLRRSKGNVYNMLNAGILGCFKPNNGRLLFKKADLVNWIESAAVSSNAAIEAQAAARS